MSFNIDWLRPFWFGQHTYNDTTLHVHYVTIHFANKPNIEAQIWLNLFSPGAKYSNGAVTALGAAAAGFYYYSYVDPSWGTLPMLLGYGPWTTRLRIDKVVFLTAWFHVRLASAKADGMIYYWSDGIGSRQTARPPHTESVWCIFDQSTGEVLATETIWTEEGADPVASGPSPALLDKYSTLRGGGRRNLGSLAIDRVPGGEFRIDLERRTVMETPGAPAPGLMPPDSMQRDI